ncbi:MAG: trypsin-like peptidase domain-containing protein [Lewinellaceae bacterium]|nr:trypsin-like peptidase domain-containing protein [Lewinellaceae bacterium]
MSDFIDLYRAVIVQIATPNSTGTGFYLRDRGLIVTNFHVVEGNRAVIIEGGNLPKQLVSVLYADRKYDLAFLAASGDLEQLPTVQLAPEGKQIKERDPVTAMGHPFGLKFSVKSGIVSNTREMMNNIPYLHIDAALNPGNSGGPLVDNDGEVVGVNTFIIRDGDNIGFSLPVHFLRQSLEDFSRMGSKNTSRCLGCANVVSEKEVDGTFCSHCGHKVELPGLVEAYVPTGVPRTIETIISRTNNDVSLSRCGPNAWEIRHGSAKITITYHDKTGLMTADAILCHLPKENIKPLYEYLLRENCRNEGLTFSVHEQDILLSLLIYDRYLNEDTGLALLNRLFEKADHYDNILVEEYGGSWKQE